MLTPAKLTATFHEEKFYHIICKSLQNQKLFHSDENRFFFMKRSRIFLSHYISTYAYCLLNNHVHFIIRIKKINEVITHLKSNIEEQGLSIRQKSFLNEPNECTFNALLERQFNSFFVSYTRCYNIYYKRKGHLFENPFKRILLEDEAHITQVIVYVYANAQKHGLANGLKAYKWSS